MNMNFEACYNSTKVLTLLQGKQEAPLCHAKLNEFSAGFELMMV